MLVEAGVDEGASELGFVDLIQVDLADTDDEPETKSSVNKNS